MNSSSRSKIQRNIKTTKLILITQIKWYWVWVDTKIRSGNYESYLAELDDGVRRVGVDGREFDLFSEFVKNSFWVWCKSGICEE